MPVVISNTSPLQYLNQADMLFLMPALFDRIYVPEAVVSEIESIRPILDRFDELRFRLHPTTRKTILRLAHE